MATPPSGARITIGGALPSGEGWQSTFYTARADNTEMTLLQALAFADGWMTGFKSTAPDPYYMSQMDSGTTSGPPKVQLIDGATGALGEKGVGTVGWAGTQDLAGSPLPPAVAVVVTLRGSGDFLKVHGRFYLPPPLAACVESHGRIRDETIHALVNSLEQAAVSAGNETAGGSQTRMAIWTGLHTALVPARRAEVGDVFDTQRSRRSKLVERRTMAAIGG